MIKELTLENFESVLNASKQPLVVDFWAEWCAPCRMMRSIFESLSARRTDILFARANVDEIYPIAVHFGISSIPAFLLFENGQVVARSTGYQTEDELLASLGIV